MSYSVVYVVYTSTDDPEHPGHFFKTVDEANAHIAALPAGCSWSMQSVYRRPGRVSVRLVARSV